MKRQLCISFYLNSKIVVWDNLPKIKWNRFSIVTLFHNLIENGITYNSSANPTIKISMSNRVDSYSIDFQDNGIGIEEQFQQKVFDMLLV